MDIAEQIAARERIQGHVAVTPLSPSRTLSALTGADVWLKFENLQFTSSFKERGALNCLLCLSEEERSRGVIAMSAGNHAQALAYHGRRLGVPTTIVMPRFTPNAKVAQTRVLRLLKMKYSLSTILRTFQIVRRWDILVVFPTGK
jgi:threonine dehydratase